MNRIDLLMEKLLKTPKGKKRAQSLAMNGALLLYMIGGYLFMEKEYLIAILAIIVGYGMIETRELFKMYFDLKKKK